VGTAFIPRPSLGRWFADRSAGAERAEELADVLDEGVGFLGGREVPAGLHVRELPQVVVALHPRLRHDHELVREHRHPGGTLHHRGAVVRRPPEVVRGLPVEPGGADEPADPVEHREGEQVVLGEPLLHVAAVVAPPAPPVDQPGQQRDR
jgi:hypothetical protein